MDLAAAGFDIAHDYDLRDVAIDLPPIVPRVGILVGNSRALWPVFQAQLRDEPDPLEHYVMRSIPNALYSHRIYDGAYLPFQRIAIATGLAAPSPCGLLVHPLFGPWFALRAIIASDTGTRRSPIDRPCVCTAACDAPPIGASWRAWLAARDACSLHKFRYDEDQIRFHYAATVQMFP